MKNLLILIITCCAVVTVICLAIKIVLPAQFWLWVVGLAGPVIGVLQFILQYVKKLFEQDNSQRNKKIRML